MDTPDTYTVFDGSKLLFQGTLREVLLKVKKKTDKVPNSSLLIFSDTTGKSMDFNLQGSEVEVLGRLEVFLSKPDPGLVSGPGRPKLGVVSREVSLLPRHWEWLAAQPGGASSTLRKLVEEAKKKASGGVDIKQTQERTYRVMSVLAGNFEGYEEALRALYRKDKKAFRAKINEWPSDVRLHIIELSKTVFVNS